jgi:hypothetical protein
VPDSLPALAILALVGLPGFVYLQIRPKVAGPLPQGSGLQETLATVFFGLVCGLSGLMITAVARHSDVVYLLRYWLSPAEFTKLDASGLTADGLSLEATADQLLSSGLIVALWSLGVALAMALLLAFAVWLLHHVVALAARLATFLRRTGVRVWRAAAAIVRRREPDASSPAASDPDRVPAEAPEERIAVTA